MSFDVKWQNYAVNRNCRQRLFSSPRSLTATLLPLSLAHGMNHNFELLKGTHSGMGSDRRTSVPSQTASSRVLS